MKDARISDYFDTTYMTVLRMEQISHNFEDQKFANFFNIEQVNFGMTLVIWGNYYTGAGDLWKKYLNKLLKLLLFINGVLEPSLILHEKWKGSKTR